MNLEDMRLFAQLAFAPSMTAAADALQMPKQTLSRRLAQLEADVGVQLMHRSSRSVQLTDSGQAYAQRCARIVQLAEDANKEVARQHSAPQGTLRITADPLFGRAFVGGLVAAYAKKWSQVQIELVLTDRRVDLIREGFDVAFRVGDVDESSLSATRLGPARLRYCASPAYLNKHGRPASPTDLKDHECIRFAADAGTSRWPFCGSKARPKRVRVSGRLILGDPAIVYEATRAGLGIAPFPEFLCAADLKKGRLVAVLEEWTVEPGSVFLVRPAGAFVPARVSALYDLALQKIQRSGLLGD